MKRIENHYTEVSVHEGHESPPRLPNTSIIQGEDLLLSFYLRYETIPVKAGEWILEATVKSSTELPVLWCGVENIGIFKKDNSEEYHISISGDDTIGFKPGTYYLYVKGVKRGDERLSIVLLSTSFNVRKSVGSMKLDYKPFKPGQFYITDKNIQGVAAITS